MKLDPVQGQHCSVRAGERHVQPARGWAQRAGSTTLHDRGGMALHMCACRSVTSDGACGSWRPPRDSLRLPIQLSTQNTDSVRRRLCGRQRPLPRRAPVTGTHGRWCYGSWTRRLGACAGLRSFAKLQRSRPTGSSSQRCAATGRHGQRVCATAVTEAAATVTEFSDVTCEAEFAAVLKSKVRMAFASWATSPYASVARHGLAGPCCLRKSPNCVMPQM